MQFKNGLTPPSYTRLNHFVKLFTACLSVIIQRLLVQRPQVNEVRSFVLSAYPGGANRVG
jgi:hypothetical protein